jgi:hypothetical protein
MNGAWLNPCHGLVLPGDPWNPLLVLSVSAAPDLHCQESICLEELSAEFLGETALSRLFYTQDFVATYINHSSISRITPYLKRVTKLVSGLERYNTC